jgi:hypothetical protein
MGRLVHNAMLYVRPGAATSLASCLFLRLNAGAAAMGAFESQKLQPCRHPPEQRPKSNLNTFAPLPLSSVGTITKPLWGQAGMLLNLALSLPHPPTTHPTNA